MSVYYKVLDQDGKLTEVELSEELYGGLVPLPENAASYFDLDGSFMVQIQDLVNSRARPKGIINANSFMHQAADGKLSKRPPICVRPDGSGRWVVLDGNSTVINAIVSGWKQIPCRQEPEAA